MKSLFWSWVLLLVLAALGCNQSKSQTPVAQAMTPPAETSHTTPLKTPARSASITQTVSPGAETTSKQDAPLLLDDGPTSSTARPAADNSRCHVCHLNLAEEELALAHAKAGVGCAKCHGASDAHIADESWASGGNGTAPDRMFPKDKIVVFCLECHDKGKLKPEIHEAVLAGKSEQKYCTDCHGKHRLVNRKCKWK